MTTTSPASMLFVPATSPERFAKALASGADWVCIDLEDAVAPAKKAEARQIVSKFLAESTDRARIVVRVNSLGTIEGALDAAHFATTDLLPFRFLLPKVDDARDVELFTAHFKAPPGVIALVESGRGVEASFAVARLPNVVMLMFGMYDYSAETGGALEWMTLLPVRSRIIAAASSAGKPAIDSPFRDLDDVEAAAVDNQRSRALGFAGRAAIHPKMISGINAAFSSTKAEIAEAEALVAAYNAAGGGVARLGNKLVERPVFLRMTRLIDRAKSRDGFGPG